MIVAHQQLHGQLSARVWMNAVMLSAEMSLCAGEIARTRTLLTSDLVMDLVGLDIGVLRLFLMRLEEQEQERKDEESSSIEALTESLKLITLKEGRLADVDSVRWMIGRIVESWNDLGADLRVEEDVLTGVAVELGIYPSKGQRAAWVERGLTSRCLILMFRFVITNNNNSRTNACASDRCGSWAAWAPRWRPA